MAVSPVTEERGRRKAVDADLILVPYIDLLMCMVAFLLITAVWSQLARLSVAQKGQGEGFNIIAKDEQKHVPKRGAELDYGALKAELTRLKEAHPDATDARILSEDGIVFDTLVHTMDVAMAAGFPDLSLLDAAPGR